MPLCNGGRIGSNNDPFTGTNDPNYSDVSLLLNGNGTNGITTFTDSSSHNHSITAAGNAQISTTQSKFGGSSMYFDGSGDWISAPNSSEFAFGTGDFTVEAWVNMVVSATIFDTRSSNSGATAGFDFSFSTSGPRIYDGIATQDLYSSSNTYSLNTWYHVAFCRQGTGISVFVDGILDGTAISSRNVTTQGGRVGSNINGSSSNCYIDDLRVTKGVARYTSNFTPPTAQLPGGETGTFASGVWTLEIWSLNN